MKLYVCYVLGFLLSLYISLGCGEVCTKKLCEYEFVVRETRSMMYRTDVDHAYLVMVDKDGHLKLKATPDGFHRYWFGIVV
jgi:hypothetical protein